MSILSWNCQGAGCTETVQHLRGLRRKHFPDFIFLMETKQKFSYMSSLQQSLGYDNLVTVEPLGLSGGLAVMWKNCYTVSVLSKDKRIIDLEVSLGSIHFFLTFVYGEPVSGKRQEVWDRLSSIGMLRHEAWILAGDFNELLNNTEKLGGPQRNESSFWGFRGMVSNCKIKELRSSGNSLSWGGWRNRVWVQCRLDRSFGNDEWFSLFPRANNEYLSMWASDHRPIRICFTCERDDQARGRFYFDKRMISKAGFEEIVNMGWSAPEGSESCLMERINKCRREMAIWKKRSDINSRDKITRLQVSLEEEIRKNHPDHFTMQRLKFELASALKEEETFWKQKCREEWLRSGDLNTTYFHNSVKGKKLQNRVLMLLDDNGIEHFAEGSKGHIAVEYFRDLFMSSNPHDEESIFQGFNPRVSEEMNARLIAPIREEEIKKAAFSIKGSSAPGEDGLTGLFYQRYWHIVGSSVIREVQGFFQSAFLPDGWNHTQLSLIPKIPKPSRMQDMRPISLCSIQYKIVSKILCGRLKLILPQLVSETQGAFVSGRLISDNIIIAHEMTHGLRTNARVSEEFMAIKTDISKAYDRVEWCFLEILLEKLGFDRIWINWIMACVTTVSYSVLLNGRSHGFIRPERGIRQGDPLSPFLFILCAEALVSCLNFSELSGRLHGINISASGPSVHHLLFADDSLLMCKANSEEAMEITRCLKMYEEASGQMISKIKSSIIFGARVDESTKAEVKRILGIDKEGGEGTYLGLPESFSGSKRKLLEFLREKLQGRLTGWFAKALSHGGKEILLKSVALALPVYAMSCFKLPKETCAKLTSAMMSFWWNTGDNRKKIPWVAWQKLCKPKEEGGLGFHDIAKFNQALLGKQAWRIWNNPSSLLAQILKHRYFGNCSILQSGLGTRPSYAWRSILHGRDLIKQGLMQSVGDGSTIRVWIDNWILDKIPRPPNYRQDAVIDLSMKVNQLIDPFSKTWNRTTLLQLFTDADVALILNTKIHRLREDTVVWGLEKNGAYTTRSGNQFLDTLHSNQSLTSPSLSPMEKLLWSKIWKTKTTPKLRHFLWRALSGALAVKERLRSRSIPIDVTCSRCGTEQESICHMLFTCNFAKEVWQKSLIPLPSSGFSSTSVFLNLQFLVSRTLMPQCQQNNIRAFPWVMWQIWKARNAWCFEQTSLDASQVVERALEEAVTWSELHWKSKEQTTAAPHLMDPSKKWSKPPFGVLKCNIGSSWINEGIHSGASWIARNHLGVTVFHSRMSYSQISSSLENDLMSFFWAIESLRNMRVNRVIFQASSVEVSPSWLQQIIMSEA